MRARGAVFFEGIFVEFEACHAGCVSHCFTVLFNHDGDLF